MARNAAILVLVAIGCGISILASRTAFSVAVSAWALAAVYAVLTSPRRWL